MVIVGLIKTLGLIGLRWKNEKCSIWNMKSYKLDTWNPEQWESRNHRLRWYEKRRYSGYKTGGKNSSHTNTQNYGKISSNQTANNSVKGKKQGTPNTDSEERWEMARAVWVGEGGGEGQNTQDGGSTNLVLWDLWLLGPWSNMNISYSSTCSGHFVTVTAEWDWSHAWLTAPRGCQRGVQQLATTFTRRLTPPCASTPQLDNVVNHPLHCQCL